MPEWAELLPCDWPVSDNKQWIVLPNQVAGECLIRVYLLVVQMCSVSMKLVHFSFSLHLVFFFPPSNPVEALMAKLPLLCLQIDGYIINT